jgi:hypothetical protein
MRELRVSAKDLLFALDNKAQGVPHYLDIETGAIVPIFNFNRDKILADIKAAPARYVRLAPLSGRQGYLAMEEFARTVANVLLRNRLNDELTGENKFRGFRAALADYPEELRRWREFRANAVTQGLRDKLKESGVALVLFREEEPPA